jgi:hypothetical protein
MIHSFKTRQEEVNFVESHGLGANYLSYIKETGATSYKYNEPIKVGDFLHKTGHIDTKASDDVIGVCAVPELMLPDGKARFVSIKSMSKTTWETGSTTNETMMWDSDSGEHFTKRTKVPIDGTSSGSISSNSSLGKLAMDRTDSDAVSNLTIANTQDPGTKYYKDTTLRIPSPYALDGSMNKNYLYTDGNDDDWALLNYRGDINTNYLVFSDDPGDEISSAFYACSRFKPGYRDNEWYLPAIGELGFLAPRVEFINSKITEAIDAGSQGVVLPFGYLWSSSEYDSVNAWTLTLRNGGVSRYGKVGSIYVRAFLATP